jgi:3-deoxy-D-arabino-heptulosonate 7-phosphate (DAHP) synthase class II
MKRITWQDVCQQAVEQAMGLNLVFAGSDADVRHARGACQLIGAHYEPSEIFDEEALPVYIVKTAAGEILDVFEEELQCEDTEGLAKLIEGVSMTYGLARQLGSVGPSDLMKYASLAVQTRFLALLASDRATKLAVLDL